MRGWRIGGLRLWLPLCHHSVAENTHFILINEITPSAPRKVKGHEATCVRTCLFLLKKKKKKSGTTPILGKRYIALQLKL